MKREILLFFCLIFSFTIFGQRIILKNANLIPINENTILKKKSILIKNGKIIQIDKFKNLNKEKTDIIIDATGKFIMPGLADMHVHLPEMKKIDTLLMSNIASGVTQIRVMNSSLPEFELKKKINSNPNYISPNIHYSYIYNKKNKNSQLDSIFSIVKEQKLEFIKMLSVKDEKSFDSLMLFAKKNNAIVCGHNSSTINFKKILNSGYKSIEHLGGYPNDENYSKLDEYIKLTKTNNVYNCPTLDFYIRVYNYDYPSKFRDRLTYKSAPKKYIDKWEKSLNERLIKNGELKFLEAGKEYAETFERQKLILKKLYQNNCLLLIGSDPEIAFQMAGFSIYDEMKDWSEIGIDNYYILKSATLVPATFFSEEKDWGSIEVGKNADLIILRKNPLENIQNIETVETTILKGKIYQKSDLLKRL